MPPATFILSRNTHLERHEKYIIIQEYVDDAGT